MAYYDRDQKSKEYVDAMDQKLDALEGKNKKFADVLRQHYRQGYHHSGDLHALLLENQPDIKQLTDRVSDFLKAVLPEDTAGMLSKMILRLPEYNYQHSSYRRSYKSKELRPYLGKICEVLTSVYFNWEEFSLARYLGMSRQEITDQQYPVPVNSLVTLRIALAIDEGDTEVIEKLKDIILSDNNVHLLDYVIIQGVAKSHSREMHLLMRDLLLAAKLQEGLRQSILETADDGCLDYFLLIMEAVLEHDLLRFSSAKRAVDVWMGVAYEYDDKRALEKMLRLACTYLKDADARKTAFGSKDVTELFAALYAESVFDIGALPPYIDRLMQGEKYQKLVGLYMLSSVDSGTICTEIAAKHLNESDLDILAYVLRNYHVSSGWVSNKKDFIAKCRNHRILESADTRSAHFESFSALLEVIPKEGHRFYGKPFAWSGCSLAREDVYNRMIVIAGYEYNPDMMQQLMELSPMGSSDARIRLIQYLLEPERSPAERSFLLECLHDKSMPVRVEAVKLLSQLDLSDSEIEVVENLLSLKTGKIRQSALKILGKQPKEVVLESVQRLITQKAINKRLGALDLLTQLSAKNEVSREQALQITGQMPKVTEQEKVLIDQILSGEQQYHEGNGFGLYDPSYRPSLPEVKPNAYTLEKFRAVSVEEMQKTLHTLIQLIEEHKDDKFIRVMWDNSENEAVFGTLTTLLKKPEFQRDRERVSTPDDYILIDVWRKWLNDSKADLMTILKICYCIQMKDYRNTYTLSYRKWANDLIESLFGWDDIQKMAAFFGNTDYAQLAGNIASIMLNDFAEQELFAVRYGIMADLFTRVQPEQWKEPAEEQTKRYYYDGSSSHADQLCALKEVSFFAGPLKNTESADDFQKALALYYQISDLSDIPYCYMNETTIARAVQDGLVEENEIYSIFMQDEPARKMSAYTGTLYHNAQKTVERYPLIKKAADIVAQRVIDIELKRGDMPTPVSRTANSICEHKGIPNFVEILVSLGNETLARGYYYGDTYTKRQVLSSLLKCSQPEEGDNAEKLREALNGRIPDKRLLEAAMYAPKWINIIQDYLGWKGLKSAAWYFHAHTNNSVSAEFETEVARYSPISRTEFQDGAFDVNWFKDAYKTLGKQKFEILYDCAKYISEGGSHRRAQLFSDAVLGKLKKRELKKTISDKRNKDLLLCLSLIPFAKNKMNDALDRYEFIQNFLKESKQFGAQRRESEGKVSAIALDNLARNLGYSDSLRFAWKMEVLKIEKLQKYFTPHEVEGTTLYIVTDDSGSAGISVEKGGKKLKSVPAKLKKHKYVTELKEIVASLKDQFRRARASLEKAMETQDEFPFSEVQDLMLHPVIKPLIQKLVFQSGDSFGFLTADGLTAPDGDTALSSGDTLTIAHSYHLYQSGKWGTFQRYAFEQQLVQPFKQIFRELYLINEDEKAEKTKSRRYAGHQVQPKRTVGLLRGRGWTVDYDSGLQKVHYKENVIATMYALADWFSPSDIEPPTLETVQFYDRKEHKPLEFTALNPILFSETMRDVDLVVSVAHVGGVDPMASHSTIEMRAVIIREMMHLLKIENVTIDKNHAQIKGSLGEYSVHLGSGMVHLMGRGALSILPVHSQHRGRIFLPFMDEDPKTAEIVSKILLFAQDQKIKDPTVLNQIQG